MTDQDGKFESVDKVREGFKSAGYICNTDIATTVYLAFHLEKPVLVEGPAGVGKTELAKKAAAFMDVPLIRLQCYEGLDESKALYEWKYGKQLLYTQLLRDKLDQVIDKESDMGESIRTLHQYEDIFFSPQFLEPRPLLKALQAEQGAVLLIDEVDKADEEFEAFLLEILSDFQVSIPEIGTVRAKTRPYVFLTSNSTRELSEALKRRCLHLYIPFPEPDLETRDHPLPCPRHPGSTGKTAGDVHSRGEKTRTEKGAFDQRDDRLGPGPDPSACRRTRSGPDPEDPQHLPQVRGRHPGR